LFNLDCFFCFGLFSVFVFLVFKVDSRETFNNKNQNPSANGQGAALIFAVK